MSCAVSIHCSYTCKFMYILCDYFTILKNGCFACEVYWSIHLCLQACSKVVPTLQESLLIYNLVTTLLQPKTGSRGWQFQGLDNLLARLSQPCHNYVTTLLQRCCHLVTRLLQGCYSVVNTCQPCLFTTLWPPCYNLQTIQQAWQFQGFDSLLARLSQPCHNLVTVLSTHGCTTLWQGCHNLVFFYMGGVQFSAEHISSLVVLLEIAGHVSSTNYQPPF